MKKMWLLSPFILSLLASPLFGDEDGLISVDTTEIAKGFVIGQTHKKMAAEKPTANCSNPAMNYRLPADFWGVDTFVEYLLWQMQEQASYFVVNNTSSTFDNLFPNTYALGTIRSERFDWSSGVRLGFGYSFARDVWQLLGQYTWYKTDGQSAYTVQTPLINAGNSPIATNYLMQTLLDISLNGPNKVSSSGSFSYQIADLMLASAFLATDQIQFNYSLGATGGYIKENWDVTYFAAPTPHVPHTTYFHNQWIFSGGGFRVGMDTNWHIAHGFGFFGKVSFAAMLGQYTNYDRVTIDGSATFGTTQQNSTYQGIMLLPTSQFILGFDWCRAFSNCWASAVKISVAGEFNHLSDLQQVFKTTYVNSPTRDKPTSRDIGSVYMYGGTAHFGIDY